MPTLPQRASAAQGALVFVYRIASDKLAGTLDEIDQHLDLSQSDRDFVEDMRRRARRYRVYALLTEAWLNQLDNLIADADLDHPPVTNVTRQ